VKTTGIVVAAALSLTARASAADSVVELTLDGRPVDRHGGVALLHHGLVFADAIDLTKCFDGFITLLRSGAATVTIGPNTGTFAPGVSTATINQKVVTLPAAPYRVNGDLFVPLEAFVAGVAGDDVHVITSGHRADIRVNARRQR
jgi:hypothetical protein